jgi:cell division septal protein FtsQ
MNRKKSPLKSTRLAEYKRRMRTLKIVGCVLLLGLIIGGIVWISRLPSLSIMTINVVGNSAVDRSDIERTVLQDLEGNYFLVFPKHNKYLYPRKTIEQHLLTTFQRFQSADVKIRQGALEVTVVERAPSYVWCKGLVSDKNTDCYFLDTTGYIFAPAPVFSGNAYFQFYGLASSTDNPVGEHYLPSADFKNVDKFITSLTTLGVSSYALKLDSTITGTLYLTQGGELRFAQTEDYQTLLDNILTIYRQTDIFTHGENLDYIDMRFGNKVFYKLVGDNEAHQ